MMKIYIILCSFVLLGSNYTHELHDFHLSKTSVNYNSETSSLDVSMHLFLDDLELGLKEMGAENLYLCTNKEDEIAETFLVDYINTHFTINNDGQAIELFFIGKELSEDLAAVWCYFEIENISLTGDLEITNDLLVTIFDDQKNMVTIKKDKKRISDILFDKQKVLKKINI
ncbi:MAG: DUF6702 family protein [Saprospiraceae bacterium]